MAFRKVYVDLLKAKAITTIFRPGSRLPGTFRSYEPGQIVTIRVIDKVGADWANVAPEFVPDFGLQIEIKKVELLKLGELTANHFEGSSPDIQNVSALKYHLGVVYNLTPDELSDSALITRTTFVYL